jgi:hypothetical protein
VFFDVSSIGEVIAGLIKSWSSKCVEIDGWKQVEERKMINSEMYFFRVEH